MTRLFTRAIALSIFVALFAAPAAFGQQTAPPPPQQQAVEIDFTDDELDAFAEAYVDVETLQLQYQAQFESIDTPEDAQQIQQRFQAEVLQTIDKHGIAPERYDQVILATQVDPEFTEDLLARIQEVRDDRTDG